MTGSNDSKTKTVKTEAPREVWVGMTEAALRDVADYTLSLQERFGLGDWEVDISKLPLDDDDDAFAEVRALFGQRRATIHLCREWATIEPKKRRRLILHELAHLHLDSPFRYLEETLPTLVGKPAATALTDAVHERVELAVDAISTALAELDDVFPLPLSEPKGEG